MRNRIVIGVSAPNFVGAAKAKIATLKLPGDLVEVTVVAPPHAEALLTDSLRPVPGGAYITWNTYNHCTFGYNLVRYVGSVLDTVATDRYFVTNSHCTAQRNTLEYTQVQQYGYYLGSEAGDPAAFTSSYSSSCRSGYTCRFSDAALFQYTSPALADQGHIAYPTTSGGSLAFSSYMTITAVQAPMAGYSVHMIGSTSGRRSATVSAVCVDVWGIDGWTNGELLCQGKSTYMSADGDSGSPVIEPHADGTAYAIGLHWGRSNDGSRWFSPMDNVLQEFYDRLAGNPNLSPAVYP